MTTSSGDGEAGASMRPPLNAGENSSGAVGGRGALGQLQ